MSFGTILDLNVSYRWIGLAVRLGEVEVGSGMVKAVQG